jgi:DNA mismatch repair protein MutS2
LRHRRTLANRPPGQPQPQQYSNGHKNHPRLSESQQAFEATLAKIREAETEMAAALTRARDAEVRAAEARRVADEERRRARRERDEAVRAARGEAAEIVEALRRDVAESRRDLERTSITEPRLDAAVARAETHLARLPDEPAAPAAAPTSPPEPRTWAVGERARSRAGGWEGRVAALDRGGERATLEAGGMRVSVLLDDLEPVVGPAPSPGATGRGGAASTGAQGGGTNEGAIRAARARTVASSLDIRGARVDEAVAALEGYLEDASLAGLERVTIVHGLGTGALRDAVRTAAAGHPLVRDVRAGDRGEGGDGATIVGL